MAKIVLKKRDQLPEFCVICGETPTTTLRLKFAKKGNSDFATKVFSPKIVTLLQRLIPSIVWTLPFCPTHSFRAKFKHNSQTFLLILTGASLFYGIRFFLTTHLTWPLPTSIGLAFIFVFLTHHIRLQPLEVSRHSLTLGAVSGRFAEEHDRINRLPLNEESSEGDDEFNIVV